MLFFVVSALINAITSSILGCAVYFKNPKQAVNKIFGLFCASVAIWSYAYFFWLLAKDVQPALFIFRFLVMGAAIFITILFFNFTLVLIDKVKKYRIMLILGYIIFLLFFAVDYSTLLFVRGVERILYFDFWPKPGMLFHPFLAVWIFYILYAVYLIAKEINVSAGERKIRLKYMLAGTVIGFGGGATNYILWYDIPIAPFGNFLIAVGMCALACGAIKARLFDIKLITTELLTFVIWIFVALRMALSQTHEELIMNVVLLGLVLLLGLLLIRSTHNEIKLTNALLEKTKKELDFEKRLRETFAEIAEDRQRRIEHVYQVGADGWETMELKEKVKELEKINKQLERKLKRSR